MADPTIRANLDEARPFFLAMNDFTSSTSKRPPPAADAPPADVVDAGAADAVAAVPPTLDDEAARDSDAAPELAEADFADLRRLSDNIARVIVGKPEAVRLLLVALLSRGHALVEDVPGVGKTTLARALARSIDCDFRRIQFTPDLLPNDIVGVSIYDNKSADFSFRRGPVFANVLLADEINRAAPRTQSALLEAMNAFQVSVDGVTHDLPAPFTVVATQNPIEFAGTYPLPESQLDRFTVRFAIGYPERAKEREILFSHQRAEPLDAATAVVTGAQVTHLQEAVRTVRVDPSIVEYILAIVERSRADERLAVGLSPRASLGMFRAVQAAAALDGRTFAVPDDVKRMAVAVFAHRLVERAAGPSTPGRLTGQTVTESLLEKTPAPI